MNEAASGFAGFSFHRTKGGENIDEETGPLVDSVQYHSPRRKRRRFSQAKRVESSTRLVSLAP
ncbi:MAG: hypothetical protein U0905_00990 [Pirellulales bacterium]